MWRAVALIAALGILGLAAWAFTAEGRPWGALVGAILLGALMNVALRRMRAGSSPGSPD